MITKKQLKKRIDDLEEQLETKAETVTKYMAVTNVKGKVTLRRSNRYGMGSDHYELGNADQTIVLVTKNSKPDTIVLDGKWTIEQIKEAANG